MKDTIKALLLRVICSMLDWKVAGLVFRFFDFDIEACRLSVALLSDTLGWRRFFFRHFRELSLVQIAILLNVPTQADDGLTLMQRIQWEVVRRWITEEPIPASSA